MTSTSSKLSGQSHAPSRSKSRAKAPGAKAFLDTQKVKERVGMKTGKPPVGVKYTSFDALKKIRKFTSKAYSRKTAPKSILEVLNLAAAAGTPSRWALEVDAAGNTSLKLEEVKPVGEAETASKADIRVAKSPASAVELEALDEPDAVLSAALEAARARGRVRVADILAADDMMSADAFADMIGTTRVTVNAKRQKNEILGLDGAKRGFRFPTWQIDKNGKPFAQLAQLHERLGNPWGVYRFLVQAHGELDGLTGREALQRGMTQDVLAVAESVGRDFS